MEVNSKDELAERIYQYFDEVDAGSVVFHWTYKLDEIQEKEPEKNTPVNYYLMYQA